MGGCGLSWEEIRVSWGFGLSWGRIRIFAGRLSGFRGKSSVPHAKFNQTSLRAEASETCFEPTKRRFDKIRFDEISRAAPLKRELTWAPSCAGGR